MLKIKIKKNHDFGDKKCILSDKVFKPKEVVVVLERKLKGGVKRMGFISPSMLETYSTLDDSSSHLCYHFRIKIDSVLNELHNREDKQEFLQEIISQLEKERRDLSAVIQQKEDLMDELENLQGSFPSWKDYKLALEGVNKKEDSVACKYRQFNR